MKQIIVVSLITMVVLITIGCSEGQSTQPPVAESDFSSEEALANRIAAYPLEEITVEIRDGLLFMREGEKVARDIHIALAKKWDARVFNNIYLSEERHMDALEVLIERYGLNDPVGDNAEGIFTNTRLQQLYDDLLTKGSKSLKDALLVGQLIEEVGI